METIDKYKILIVDDHPVFCLGMTELINKEDDLLVCGSIEKLRDADRAIKRLQPDMVIVDIGLKDGNGLKLVEDIKQNYRDLKTLVLSMYDESLYAERAFLAGALGYLMKQEAISSVVKAIRLVRNGSVYASAQVKEKIFKRLTANTEQERLSPLAVLTNRELEVFRLIGKGFSSREISEQLHLSIKTIGTYRENIKEKLAIKHFTELVRVAVHWTEQMEF
jgi:DNA-binding NarL/FixJ family response regulator